MAALGGTQVLPKDETFYISERAGFWAMPEIVKSVGIGQRPLVEAYLINPVPTIGQVWPRNS
jgi:hypothetical protein